MGPPVTILEMNGLQIATTFRVEEDSKMRSLEVRVFELRIRLGMAFALEMVVRN